MACRHCFIVKSNGFYCVFRSDKVVLSPSKFTGTLLARQIFELVQKYHGDIQAACAHWTHHLTGCKMCTEKNCVTHLSDLHCFTHQSIEESLYFSRRFLLKCPPRKTLKDVVRVNVDRLWIIDLDMQALRIEEVSQKKELRFSMKLIYKVLRNSKQRKFHLAAWSDFRLKTSARRLKQIYYALLIQAQVRRLLAWKHSLAPGGAQYKAAKVRFESCIAKSKIG